MKVTKKTKSEWYDDTEILKTGARYLMLIGERSRGKTYSCLKRILKHYLETGKQGAYIRRWADDFKRGRGQTLFNSILQSDILEGTRWTGIDFISGSWYLYEYDEDLKKKVYDNVPFCYSFALTNMEHDKSTSYPDVQIIVFDEFISRQTPLPDEFVIFMNVLSTIIRYRTDVEIWMLANTVNKDSIYFKEMGLTNIKNMNPGEIEVYTYGEKSDENPNPLTVAVEFTDSPPEGKPSDVYFAFDNPKLRMITGGSWELAIYPHLEDKYKPKDIVFTYFIIWEDCIAQCEIIKQENRIYTYIHRKTTPIKNEDKDLIFCPLSDTRLNWRRNILNCYDSIGKKILKFFTDDKVYYQDNELGETIRAYLQYCKQYSIIKA